MFFLCVQMPAVGSDELLHVIDECHFFLLTITKTWRTHALKKSYDLLKSHYKLPNKIERK